MGRRREREKKKKTYLNHLLLCEVALLGLLDGMRKLGKGGSGAGNAAQLRSASHVGSLLWLLLKMSRLRSGRLLKPHLSLQLWVLLGLLWLHWMLRLLLHLLLRWLGLYDLLRTHDLHEWVLIVA